MTSLGELWVTGQGGLELDPFKVEKLGHGASQAMINYLKATAYLGNGIKTEEVDEYKRCQSAWETLFISLTGITPAQILAAKPAPK